MALRVLVTGTSRGLGEAIARHFLDRGDIVFGCSRSAGSIEHEAYRHVQADATDEQDVERLCRTVRGDRDGLDVLVNNAGWARMLPVALTPLSTARRILDTNFISTFLLTRAAVRLLRSSHAPRIVNVTSVAVPLRLDGEAVYAAAKSAVETFTRVVAHEVGAFGITCNAVGPSPIRTRLLEGVPEEKLQAILARQAVQRWAVEDDVINVIDFFVRPESSLVTGQVVYLGGVG
jgi:3-oxoacyl-[acyl-carrier protein] reductase